MKRTIAMILAACTLASAMSLSAFAEEGPEEQEQNNTPTEEVVNEPGEEQNEENEEEPMDKTTATTVFHNITIADEMMEQGYVIPSRRDAKSGDAVVLTAVEKEYTVDGKRMRMQFINFETESDVTIIPVNHTAAFFFMPDEDIVIRAVFEEVDETEYYDWESVAEAISLIPADTEYYVDMKQETEIPGWVMEVLSETDATVSFMTDNCFFTLKGEDVFDTLCTDDPFCLTYEDYTLPKYYRLKLQNSAVMAVEAKMTEDLTETAYLHCFCDKDIKRGYLYRMDGHDAEFIAVVEVENGETTLPISESGVYAVTTKVLAGTEITMISDSDKRVIVNDKLMPLTSYEYGLMHFTVTSTGSVSVEDYKVPYTDIRNHTYENAIRFVAVRNLMDGADDTTFYPDAGVVVDDLVFAIARLRQISDKAAMDFCEQAGILNGSYAFGTVMTRNDVSLIMTNFANYVSAHPEQFGNINPDAFDKNAAGWIGIRFIEMAGNSGSFDWTGTCTRGELAYILQSMVNSMVGGDAR